MSVLKSIIEKLKLKELFSIIFIGSWIITLVPDNFAQMLRIDEFRNKYQTYISLCIIIVGAYYVLKILEWIIVSIKRRLYSAEKNAIRYLKESMTPDEMKLLIEKFYDKNNNVFRSAGWIDLSDGRKAALENKFILYQAASVSNWGYTFAYNLQPYAYNFLNENLKSGNIQINEGKYKLM